MLRRFLYLRASPLQAGVYRGRKPSLTAEQAKDLRKRVASGGKKAVLAREFGISRGTLYQYLHA